MIYVHTDTYLSESEKLELDFDNLEEYEKIEKARDEIKRRLEHLLDKDYDDEIQLPFPPQQVDNKGEGADV